jgi:hypothetical protein
VLEIGNGDNGAFSPLDEMRSLVHCGPTVNDTEQPPQITLHQREMRSG